MEPNGILVDRTNKNHIQTNTKIMNTSINSSPKARPLPQFFLEQSNFSTKKEKQTPKCIINPPRPPIKSCPPISRLKPFKKPEKDIPRIISFVKSQANFSEKEATSPHYDRQKNELFFEQCFVSEGSLGCGSFGKVYRVRSREDNQYYAIKKSKEKFKGISDRIRKLQEVAKHEELPHHPNCVRFYRAWEEKQRLYIQTELCQTSLNKYAETHHDIPESVIWAVIVDLLQALEHLHTRKLVHMDIKPDNIFITFDGHYKLGDFGLVIDISNADLKEVQEGDPKYLAPEILQNSMNITCAADIFSLGMTILELATDLDLPRSGDLWHELRSGKIPQNLIKNLSSDLVHLITQMIEPDHLKRATVKELLTNSRVQYLILAKDKSFKYHLWTIYNQLNTFLLTFWHFILKPYQSLKEKLNFHSFGDLDYFGAYSINNNNLSSSTPKKVRCEMSDSPYILNGSTKSNKQEIHNNFNDTLSTNYSCGKALDDSSSFGDLSGFSNHNKSHEIGLSVKKLTKTEPPKNFAKKKSLLKLESSYPNSSSPCKTPPWKPMSSFYSYNLDNTPNGLANKRLVFDEYEEIPARDSYRSLTPSPTDSYLDKIAKEKATCFGRVSLASPASTGDDYSSDSSTEQLSVKLNFKL